MSYFKYLLTAIIINLSPVVMMSQNIKMDFDGYIDSSPRIELSISFEINASNIEQGQYATAKNCRVIYHNAEGTYGTPSGYFQGGQLFFDLNLPYRLIAEGYNVIVFDKVPENLQQVIWQWLKAQLFSSGRVTSSTEIQKTKTQSRKSPKVQKSA